MKLKHYSTVLILSCIFSFAQSKDSFVLIKGTTNINTFRCINNDFHQQIPVSVETSQKNKFSETTINLSVSDFDCKNKVMTNDFKTTLNAHKFPYLSITFLDINKISDNKFKACIQVKMMNKIKKYNVDFNLADNNLIGNKTLYFSDFEITPPKKFGGMVYVKDALDLSFSLKVKQ